MSYQLKFTGWKSLTIEDLLVAYRKAKADCFFESFFPTTSKFAEYEQDLLNNLNKLLEQLQADSGFEGNIELLGEPRLFPKSLTPGKKNKNPNNDHFHFSDPERAFNHLRSTSGMIPEFRIVGDFPVDTHIISALWINSVGEKLDAKLDDCCYASRLKRIRNDEVYTDKKEYPFHVSSIGSFLPYYQPYQRWRSDGLKAIRSELDEDRDIIAISLDLKTYYHLIDPLVLASKELYEKLDIKLTDEELKFTVQLANFLSNWSKSATKFANQIANLRGDFHGGLVIGLTASRIISNLILHTWDKLVIEKLSPIHYGRYVDDMILVIRDAGTVTNSKNFMEFLQERLGDNCISPTENSAPNNQIWQIQLDEQILCKTELQLQPEKQKLFVLKGRTGIDLLDSIEKEINQLSSEYRLMPSPDKLNDSTAAKVLSATSKDGEGANTLRRADNLTIRRLGWALQLRHVETLAQDLPRKEWKKQRKEFYQFAHNHILTPNNLFAYFIYLPRLFGFAIGMNDWLDAEKIVLKSFEAVDSIKAASNRNIRINGTEANLKQVLWSKLNCTLALLFVDAGIRYLHLNSIVIDKPNLIKERLNKYLQQHISIDPSKLQVNLNSSNNHDSSSLESEAKLVALADLANLPYKQIIKGKSANKLIGQCDIKKEKKILKVLKSSKIVEVKFLKQFLDSTKDYRLSNVKEEKKKKKQIIEGLLPYIFPTRPLTATEISELAPECVGLPMNNGKKSDEVPSVVWARFTQALRGIWIKPTLLARKQDEGTGKSKSNRLPHLKIGTGKKKKIVVALTNIKTEHKDWEAMASNQSNPSHARYHQISELVNETLKLSPKPDYVLFPELCIPLRWVDSIANCFSEAGISLIAGTEYRHYDKQNKLLSEVVLVLEDNRLGYRDFSRIKQPKLEPSVHEDHYFTSMIGKSWAYSSLKGKRKKPVYVHNGFNFGVMICSELLNGKSRIRFQGEVDALMVLSWNKDLDTFSSLVESTALDVHAYTILVNNRLYGDSRIRSPAKESFMRDIARIRGGDNNFVVVATLDIDALRAFQSRAKRWPQNDDKFKPLPEGFVLSEDRRRLPPK